ncbi:hypothetical protein ID866_1764 [Astraeus odoratus]|nr:hypothetical protein ID866_1764 [Astraeus odoratus]
MMSDLVSSGPPKQHLSPEQLAIAEEKRLKRQAKKLQQRRNTELIEKPQYLERQWVSLLDPAQRVDRTHTVKLMTWNVGAVDQASVPDT